MKQVTLMVTDETARYLDRLIEKGHVGGGKRMMKKYEAYTLALMSRPIKGERWLSVGDSVHEQWKRLPSRLSFGGSR